MTERRPSAYRALAQAHLRTPVERAVFAVLAGGARRWWTASGSARAASVSALDADQTLRRFAAAGIADQATGTAGRRYRYRADMAYLHGDADIDEESRDPVCGMPVAAGTPHVADDGGRAVRFCSVRCLALWQRARRRSRTP